MILIPVLSIAFGIGLFFAAVISADMDEAFVHIPFLKLSLILFVPGWMILVGFGLSILAGIIGVAVATLLYIAVLLFNRYYIRTVVLPMKQAT